MKLDKNNCTHVSIIAQLSNSSLLFIYSEYSRVNNNEVKGKITIKIIILIIINKKINGNDRDINDDRNKV